MAYKKFDKNSKTYQLLNADTGLNKVIEDIKKIAKKEKLAEKKDRKLKISKSIFDEDFK